MSYLERARSLLAAVEARGLRRSIRPSGEASPKYDFASNDYLGLSASSPVVEAMRSASFVGSGGSRLLSGAHREHAALEEELAAFVKRERALLFSSGYLAAIGAVHTAARLVESAYSDAHNHASVIDGLRLTRMASTVFPHRALPPRAQRSSPALVISESVFGTSGHAADVGALLAQLGSDDMLLLDEAHALGVYGPGGAGLAAAHADERIIVLGTLSKGFGCLGGFIAGPHDFIELALNIARTFIFDTSLPVGIAAAARAALREIQAGDALRAHLAENVASLTAALRPAGWSELGQAPILPLIVGEARRAVELGLYLRRHDIYAPAIRPPTVPLGTSRLRLVVRADHTREDIEALSSALQAAAREGFGPGA